MRKLTIKEATEFAKKKGGNCLSEEYIDSRSKLRWQCKNKHDFLMTLSHVKTGHWCPACSGVARLSMEEMHSVAASRKGKCLSRQYKNVRDKLKWQCKDGHEWEASPSSIRRGGWCPHCARNIKLTIEEMQTIAKKRGGNCISTEYINSITNLEWECKKGHRWRAAPSDIKNLNHWCPHCYNERRKTLFKYTIQDMQELANQKNGKCLSEKYLGNARKLQWQCSKGHIWNSAPDNIRPGCWCPICGREQSRRKRIGRPRQRRQLGGDNGLKYTIHDMEKLAKQNNGHCLSREYAGARTKLLWECHEGHRWMQIPNTIKNGFWCPDCGGSKKLTIEEMHQIAKERGGECLSKEYINTHTKLKWRCKKGHEWLAQPTHVKISKSWCPYCNELKNENACRKILKSLFRKPFNRVRPEWLINPRSGMRLELDGYNDELNIAFEYNGEQHYREVDFFRMVGKHKTLRERKRVDKAKRKICEQRGITLIVIPYTENKNLEQFILLKLRKSKIEIPQQFLEGCR